MSLWTNEKFMRNGADITITSGDPDDVKLYAYENRVHYLLAVVDEEGAVLYNRKDGYHRETMSDEGSDGVEIHDGQNTRLKPGKSTEIKFADGSIATVTANDNKGITQNGLTGIAYTAEREKILYPPMM